MTGDWWAVIGHAQWPGMPSRSDMSSCPFGKWPVVAVDRACPVNGRSVGHWMPGDSWPLAGGLVLPWVQVPRELPPIWVLPQSAGP